MNFTNTKLDCGKNCWILAEQQHPGGRRLALIVHRADLAQQLIGRRRDRSALALDPFGGVFGDDFIIQIRSFCAGDDFGFVIAAASWMRPVDHFAANGRFSAPMRMTTRPSASECNSPVRATRHRDHQMRPPIRSVPSRYARAGDIASRRGAARLPHLRDRRCHWAYRWHPRPTRWCRRRRWQRPPTPSPTARLRDRADKPAWPGPAFRMVDVIIDGSQR